MQLMNRLIFSSLSMVLFLDFNGTCNKDLLSASSSSYSSLTLKSVDTGSVILVLVVLLALPKSWLLLESCSFFITVFDI
jgi:hypothetical protein